MSAKRAELHGITVKQRTEAAQLRNFSTRKSKIRAHTWHLVRFLTSGI